MHLTGVQEQATDKCDSGNPLATLAVDDGCGFASLFELIAAYLLRRFQTLPRVWQTPRGMQLHLVISQNEGTPI